MSWNFSVTGNDEAEAFNKFQEKLWQNGAHVPFAMGDQINDAARCLAQAYRDAQPDGARQNIPPNVRKITLASNGHFNETGDGNVSVTLHVLPFAPQDDDQNGQ